MEKVRRRNFFNKRGSAEIALVFKIEKVGISSLLITKSSTIM